MPVPSRSVAIILLLVAGSLLLLACASPPPFPNPLAPSPTPTPTVTPTPTPILSPTEEPKGTATPAVINLVWWTPAWFSPNAHDPAGELLAQRIQAFEEANPNIRVQVLTKLPSGKGGITDYLQGAYRVAPSLLPDVVMIDLQDLPTLSGLGILQPLDGLLPESIVRDLYPVALQAGVVDNALVAVQFEANFFHVAYLPEQVPSVPATWESLLNADTPYLTWIFTTVDDVSDVVVFQYVASGGELPGAETPPLDEQVLFSLFNFYDQIFRRGVVPEQAREPLMADVLWSALQRGDVAMVDVSARRYLREGVSQANIAAAPLPTWDGQPRALTRGWGIAITTSDPARREAALAFMAWLLAPETLGPWSQSAGYIPTRRSALASWNVPPTYRDTLDVLLQNAIPYPAHAAVASLRHALTAGLQALLQEGVSPEEAVQRARETYTP